MKSPRGPPTPSRDRRPTTSSTIRHRPRGPTCRGWKRAKRPKTTGTKGWPAAPRCRSGLAGFEPVGFEPVGFQPAGFGQMGSEVPPDQSVIRRLVGDRAEPPRHRTGAGKPAPVSLARRSSDAIFGSSSRGRSFRSMSRWRSREMSQPGRNAGRWVCGDKGRRGRMTRWPVAIGHRANFVT